MEFRNKFIKIIAFATAITLTFSFYGCTSTENVTTETAAIQETPSAQATADQGNTYETIAVTEPEIPNGNDVLQLLQSYGFNESALRKEYTFDYNNLDSYDNKCYILDRMCNSIDYFTTLQCSYTETVNGKTTLHSYAIDRRIDKSKEILYNVSSDEKLITPANYVCIDGDYHWKMIFKAEAKEKYTLSFSSSIDNPDSKTVDSITELIQTPLKDKLSGVSDEPQINSGSHTTEEEDFDKYLDVSHRVSIKDDMAYLVLQRTDTIGLIYSKTNYLPQYFALSSLYDFSSWSIDGVESDGINEIISLSGTYKDNGIDKSFKLSIDKKSGVIVTKQIFNASGKLIENWNNIQLMVDCEIDENIFDNLK